MKANEVKLKPCKKCKEYKNQLLYIEGACNANDSLFGVSILSKTIREVLNRRPSAREEGN